MLDEPVDKKKLMTRKTSVVGKTMMMNDEEYVTEAAELIEYTPEEPTAPAQEDFVRKRTVVLFGENRLSFRDFEGRIISDGMGASLSFQVKDGREMLLFSVGV